MYFLFQVSAYLEKFISKKLKNFIQPVINWKAKKEGIFSQLSAKLHQITRTQNEVDFETFIRFIIFEIQSNTISYGSLHWWPFTQLCDLCHVKYDFIGKVETWYSDISYLLKRNEFSVFDLKSLISQKFNENQEKTTKDTSLAYFKQLNSHLIVQLYNLYKNDFLIGGYDYPQNYIDMFKKNETD